jgi:predicted CXXCH cytochrome family protein
VRKIGLLLVALAALAMVPAVSFGATIAGSVHDLSGQGWGPAGDQICVFCHTPHNALAPQLVPLWNHAATTSVFMLYTSASLNAAPGQPAGVSKACLSCHDGTVALDSYGANAGTHFITGSPLLGTDLSNDHPVSFTYDAALVTADGGGLVTPESASWVDAGQTAPLYAAKLECGSCHNVHDPQFGDFLRKSNAASALCLTCHLK